VESPTLFPNGTAVRDQPRALVPHDEKGYVRDRLTRRNDFDYVCSNPPYVGEKGHKELFRNARADYPFWDKHYQGKMDYLYWFIILGLRKLREGGKLGFITTSYWPTADGASHLREYILENSIVQEIIDFGETRFFEGAPGQHNMVFVLERCSNQVPNNSSPEGRTNAANVARKTQHRIKLVKVKSTPPPKRLTDARSAIARVIDHIADHIDSHTFSDDCIALQPSTVTQSELTGKPWIELTQEARSPITERIELTAI
jgi:methylase of polypeptide subunit release factors